MKYIDLGEWVKERKDILYNGAEEKTALQIGKDLYMFKYKRDRFPDIRDNHVSEHLGCEIYRSLGVDAQVTKLSLFEGRQGVLCKDFVFGKGVEFVPFNDLGESTIDEDIENVQYTYEEICRILNANKKMECTDCAIERFWQMYVVDAFIANFDRHGRNWGFIRISRREYQLAPVFDCGSCLYSKVVSDERLLETMNDPIEMENMLRSMPMSQIQLRGKRSSYFDVITSMEYPELNKAIIQLVPRIDMTKIDSIVDEALFIGDAKKRFIKSILRYRYTNMLLPVYLKLKRNKCYEG